MLEKESATMTPTITTMTASIITNTPPTASNSTTTLDSFSDYGTQRIQSQDDEMITTEIASPSVDFIVTKADNDIHDQHNSSKTDDSDMDTNSNIVVGESETGSTALENNSINCNNDSSNIDSNENQDNGNDGGHDMTINSERPQTTTSEVACS